MIPIWYGVFLAMATAYFGFWYGRSRNWGLIAEKDGMIRKSNTVSEGLEQEERYQSQRRTLPAVYHPGMRYLASPTGGTVAEFPIGENHGVKIQTTETRLYSPSSGRVLSIAPRGNAFVIMTDWGDEVEVRACSSEDDLLDRYFRPRVIRGEIVRKGKLLLEYDREKLSGECEDMAVYLTARGEENGKLEFTQEEEVRAGDALFWVV